jgi:serine/threonine protein kinase
VAYTYRHGDRPLEGYTIQRAVGRGGFGEVYYALSDGGREVALKYLRENPNVELRGISHCMNLKSPHLVSIFDVRKNADGEYFVIMEYVSGPSLRDLLVAEPNGLGPQKAAFFIREIAKGLAYLHDQGIVHRDLKPANIFYDEGYVKIGDYGLSKFISVSRHSAQTTSVGTVHYMAPEVGSGNYQRGIDIYAMGVMLYEMLLGTVPFEGSSMGEVLMKHLTEQPEVDHLPAPFGAVIRKALAKDPNDRYQTIYEMVEDLLDVDDVKSSLAGFNPVSLGTVTRSEPVMGSDSPVPSPNPAPRAPAGGAARPVGHFELDARQLPRKMAKRINTVGDKVDKRIRKLEKKHGPRPGQADAVAAPPTQPADPVAGDWARDPAYGTPMTTGEVIQRLILALAMAVGLGVGLGFIVDAREEGFASAIMGIVGLAGGITAGTWLCAFLSRRTRCPRWLERVSRTIPCAITIGIAMIPFGDRYGDAGAASWAALMVVTFVARWRDHLESGARGEMSLWKSGKVALFALILVSIFGDGSRGDDEAMRLCAGVAAGASLVLQALAWLFHLTRWLDEADAPRMIPLRTHAAQSPTGAPTRDANAPGEPQPPLARKLGGRHADGHRGWHERPDHASMAVPAGDGSFIVTGPPKRFLFTRILAGLAVLGCLVGLIAIILFSVDAEHHLASQQIVVHTYADGQYTHAHEVIGGSIPRSTIVARIAALAGAVLGLLMLALRKMTARRTGGFYRDTLRPVLMTIVLMGLAGTGAVLVEGAGDDMAEAAAFVVLILFAMAFLFLLVKRGRRWEPGESPIAPPSDPPAARPKETPADPIHSA